MPADNLGFARVARLPEIDLARLALGVELGDQIVGHFAHVAAALGRRRRRWREHFGGMAPLPLAPLDRVEPNHFELARRAVDAKVESAYLELEARQTQAQLYRETILPSSRKLEEMSEESYRAGKASILTVLSAQRDVQQGERDYLDSLLAVESAFSELEEAVGAPLD